MVIGRLSKVNPGPEICLFCRLFRNEVTIPRASRRFHSGRNSQAPAEASALLTREKTDTDPLYAATSSGSSASNGTTSPGDGETKSLYGKRYTTREPPSWKRKTAPSLPVRDGLGQTAATQESTPELDILSKSSERIQRPGFSPKAGAGGSSQAPLIRRTLVAGKEPVESTPRFTARSKWKSPSLKGTPNRSDSVDAEISRDSLTNKPPREVSWTQLPRRTAKSVPQDPIAATGSEPARFSPFASTQTAPPVPRHRPERQEQNRNSLKTSGSSFVGFQKTDDSTPPTIGKMVVQNLASVDMEEKEKESATPADSSPVSRRTSARRAAFMEAIEEQTASSKSKQNKGRKSSRGIEDEDELDDLSLMRLEEKARRKAAKKVSRHDRASGQTFIVPSFISVGNLATSLKIRMESFSKVLRGLGFTDLSNDHIIDAETAGLIAVELGFKAVLPSKRSETDLVARPPPETTEYLPSRPPVVTIMGHVDHGKTTLLDWLRKSSVAASEHGGITQHIGAFTVQMPSGRIITFLDTPGHEAFLDMRARGANVTDIVILVVAADDSVKPQTIEAIRHAKAARTQIVVAISKIDKPEADPERVKQDLARHGIEVEDFGGDTQTVGVSGKTGEGMEQLEDAIIALADVLDVKADTDGDVEGWVLEASRKASGKIATILVRRGTLRAGQIIVAGQTWSRVRMLRDETGAIIDEALPGTPVEVDGWDEQPEAGAEVLQAPNEQRARRVVDFRAGVAQIEKQTADVAAINEARKIHDEQYDQDRARKKELGLRRHQKLPDLPQQGYRKSGFSEVPLIIRADVSGSVEAVNASVLALGNTEIRANVVRASVGAVTESDIEHAAAIQGYVINFNTPLDGDILRMAEQSGVRIIDGNVIYRVIDEVKTILEDQLPPIITHHVTGEADVLQVFEISLKGKKTLPVAGCRIRNGSIVKGSKVKVLRGEEIVYDGILSTLKNVKKDVSEMRKGNECGMSFDDYKDFQAGDQIQCYETKSQKRLL